jgi:putative (di)nucleoside polyphosphate hydrolase
LSESILRFRPNVAAILRRQDGKILICERSDFAGAWQFPQGGVNPGETHEQALVRELEEEISLKPGRYRIVESSGPYRYAIGGGKTKKGFHGQEQQYFLLDFLGDDSDIDVEVDHQEFSRVCWIAPESFELSWLPPMKRDVYTAVFKNLFGVRLKAAFRD